MIVVPFPFGGGGGGACGREVHCEAYPPGEAVYDLASRDLPAAGLDAISETGRRDAERPSALGSST